MAEDKNTGNELFIPEEMQSPFDSIKEVDTEGREWWNSRKLDETVELQLSTAIKKILIPSDNCDDTGVILYNLDAINAVGYRVNNYEVT